MSKKTMTKLRVAILGLGIFLFIMPFMVGAAPWADPTCAPPNCNTEGPVWVNPDTSQEGYIDLDYSDNASNVPVLQIVDTRTSAVPDATLDITSAVNDKPAIYGYTTGTGDAYGAFFDSNNNAGLKVGGGIKFVGLNDLNEPTYVADGLLYYNTSSHVFKYYDSSALAWQEMSSPWTTSGDEIYHSLSAGTAKGVAIKTGDTSGPNDDYTLDLVRKAQTTTADRVLNAYLEDVSDSDYVSGSLGVYDSGEMVGVRGKVSDAGTAAKFILEGTGRSYGINIDNNNSSSLSYGIYVDAGTGGGDGIRVYGGSVDNATLLYTYSTSTAANNVYGVESSVASPTGRAVYGRATGTGAVTNYGGYFTAGGDTARAVYGQATGTATDINYGGYFVADGDEGNGVYGEATATGVWSNAGGEFHSAGNNGFGVYGEADASTGASNYGGYFISNGDTGYGVYANAGATGAYVNYGGYFTSAGDNGRGIYGYASASGAVSNLGGMFRAEGDSGSGIYSIAASTNNVTNYGGRFIAQGGSGRAVYGEANSGTGLTNYGGYFTAAGPTGIGVYGVANNSGANTNYGGWFTAAGTTGIGAYATAASVGLYGRATGSTGVGVFAYGPDTTTGAALEVYHGSIQMEELTTLPTNTAGFGKVYVKDSDSKLYFQDDAGTEYDLTAGAGVSANIDDGTAQGQTAFWDNTGGTWTYTETGEMVWDDTNKRLGIGVAAPATALQVAGSYVAIGNNLTNRTIAADDGDLYVEEDLEVDLRAYIGSSLYIGSNSAIDDDYLYFDSGSESIMWDESETRFAASDDLYATGYLQASVGVQAPAYYDSVNTAYFIDPNGSNSGRLAGDLSIGYTNSATADDYLYFNYAADYLMWDDSEAGFIFSNDLAIAEGAAPTATAGRGKFYVKSTDSLPYFMDDSGAEYSLTGGSGGGSELWDTDSDTGIQVEEGADDDTFRVDAGGVGDRVLVDSSTVILGTLFGNAYIGLDNSSSGTSVVASTGTVKLGDPEALGNGIALIIDDSNSKIWTDDSVAIGTSTLDSTSTLTVDRSIASAGVDATGVYTSASNSAAGGNVYGVEATATGNGSVYGGSFTASGGAVGTGVYGSGATYGGNFNSTSGYGVQATSTASAGRGVFGQATYTAVDSVTYGGYFTSSNDSGVGIYGEGSAVGGDGVAYNYGGYFVANGPQGIGAYAEVDGYGDPAAVKGLATSTVATTNNYGGHFTAAGGLGMGVYGTSTSSDASNIHYGGYFTAPSGDGIGVYGAGNQAAAYFNGNVGINNNSPAYGLEITGDMRVGDGGSYDIYLGDSASAPTLQALYLMSNGSNAWIKNYLDAGNLLLQAGTTAGYSNTIQINGGSGTDNIIFANGGTTTNTFTNTGDIYVGQSSTADDDYLYFDGGTSEYIRWYDASTRFEVSDELYAQTMSSGAYYGSTGTTYYVDPDNSATSANFASNIYIGRDDSTDDDLVYFDAGSEYLMWDESATNFYFSDDIYTALTIRSGSNTYVDDNLYLNYDQSSSYVNILFGTTGSTAAEYIQYNPTGDDFTISGDVYARTTLLSSDERLKENIVDIDDSSALKIIGNLRPVTFDWKENGDKDYGFIAQEMYEYLPDLVDRPEDDGYWSVEYANITAVLTAAMQEQQKEIEDLEARLEKLEAKLAE